jgi:hypothetical protein
MVLRIAILRASLASVNPDAGFKELIKENRKSLANQA